MWRVGWGCRQIVAACVRACDWMLRAVIGIQFSLEKECILRMARVQSRESLELNDGTRILRGAWIGELHLWNQHLRCVVGSPRGLGTGARLRKYMHKSLSSLAVETAIEPEFANITAFHARVCRFSEEEEKRCGKALALAGFTVLRRTPRFAGRVHDRFEDFLIRALVWVFNRDRAATLGRTCTRMDLWISREQLLRDFAPAAGSSVERGAPGLRR